MKGFPLEVTLMILLPLVVVAACIFTTVLALQRGFTPVEALVVEAPAGIERPR